MKARAGWLTFLALGPMFGILFATEFAIIFAWSLPPSDGAYGRPFDRFMIEAILVFGGIPGLIAVPFMYFAMRSRRLSHMLTISTVPTVAWIAISTPFIHFGGWLGSYYVFGASLVMCLTREPVPQMLGICDHCGYNLTGNVSGICPECGTAVALHKG